MIQHKQQPLRNSRRFWYLAGSASLLSQRRLQAVFGSGSISSATYAGIPLTRAVIATSTTPTTEIWYLLAPPSGVNTMSVTVAGATDAIKLALSDYTGISQFSPIDATSTVASTTGNPSLSVTAHLTGDLVLDTLSRASTVAVVTNRIPLFNDNGSTTTAAASYQISGAPGSISDTYTGPATEHWTMDMVAFKAATTTPTVGTTTTITYTHPDQLGGTNAVTNSQGLLTENLQYYPYGGLRTDTLGGPNSGQKRKFIGQILDTPTSLDYLNKRYYADTRGGFLSEDPIEITGPILEDLVDPQRLNYYSYGTDNPITREDPSGLFVISSGLIQPGDTLGAIAGDINRAEGTTWTASELAFANGISNPNVIYAGSYIHGYYYSAPPTTTSNGGGGSSSSGGGSGSSAVKAITASILGGGSSIYQSFAPEELNPSGLSGEELLSQVTNTALRNTINVLYQDSDELPGGTAGAVRYFKLTGDFVKGSDHLDKAQNTINRINNILNDPSEELNPQDVQAANAMISDLEDALSSAGTELAQGASDIPPFP